MGMTIWRWTAGVMLGCAGVAVALIPFPPTVPRAWGSPPPARLASETDALMKAATAAHAAVRSYRTAQALERWSSAASERDTTLVRIDRTVPPAIAETVRGIAAEQWAALGAPVSAAHAEIFIYVDTTSIPRAPDSTARRRVLESRRFVDVAFALPRATDGNRCVALVGLRGASPSHVASLRSQSLVGTCGFFAAFGLPGAQISAWLAATSYRVARRSDWAVARAPATDAASIYGLSEPAGRCLTRSAVDCSTAIRLANGAIAAAGLPQDPRAWVLDAAPLPNAAEPRALPSLGDAEGQLLADAVRSVGRERFARFWTAGTEPGAAFQAAAGISLGEWTQRWLVRTYGAPSARPPLSVRDIVWLAALAPFVIVIAARPRERVLVDRRFFRRA